MTRLHTITTRTGYSGSFNVVKAEWLRDNFSEVLYGKPESILEFNFRFPF